MDSIDQGHSKPKVKLYITGFGKFGDIIDNPTTFHLQYL